MTAPSPSVRDKRHENRPGSRELKGSTTCSMLGGFKLQCITLATFASLILTTQQTNETESKYM